MSADPDLPDSPDPDSDLMVQVAAGSEIAFIELVHRHQNPLLNFFVRMGVYNDGEDLVQETFVRLHRSRERYRPTARFTTFLYVLARHVWADRGRKLARRDRLQASLKVDAEIMDRMRPVRPASGLDVQEALAKLSPKLREVVVLNVYQGLRYQDIAEVLGIPLGTVKSRLNLALTALRESLDAK
jgi:RNA polymerase sigma-70 factor (ECF subfamily)